eukprot:UN00321
MEDLNLEDSHASKNNINKNSDEQLWSENISLNINNEDNLIINNDLMDSNKDHESTEDGLDFLFSSSNS